MLVIQRNNLIIEVKKKEYHYDTINEQLIEKLCEHRQKYIKCNNKLMSDDRNEETSVRIEHKLMSDDRNEETSVRIGHKPKGILTEYINYTRDIDIINYFNNDNQDMLLICVTSLLELIRNTLDIPIVIIDLILQYWKDSNYILKKLSNNTFVIYTRSLTEMFVSPEFTFSNKIEQDKIIVHFSITFSNVGNITQIIQLTHSYFNNINLIPFFNIF